MRRCNMVVYSTDFAAAYAFLQNGSGLLILSGRNITADSEKNQKKSISLGRIVW